VWVERYLEVSAMSDNVVNSSQVTKTRAVLLVIIMTLGANVFGERVRTLATRPNSPSNVGEQSLVQRSTGFVVNRSQLDRHLVRALEVVGDRFESSAKGRSTVTGTLTRYVGSEQLSSQITIVRELPDKIRFEELRASDQRTLGYDGSRSWALGRASTSEESALTELLVCDSLEHLISGQVAGDATLHLGDMFRTDDGSNENYIGPFYDIIRVEDSFTSQDSTRKRSTLYYFNSQTGLPEKIVYEHPDRTVRIEVEFGDWMTVDGQQIPASTTWKESGKPVRRLTINKVLFAPIADDGFFNAPLPQ
jgi:hypothetical protein